MGSDKEPPTAMSAPSSGGARAVDERSAGVTQPLAQACRKGAFCDDFEEATPGARWTSSVTSAGSLRFMGPSSSFGARSLHAVTAGAGASAYLTLAGPVLPRRWAGALGFSLQLDAAPTTSLGGPELVVKDGAGGTTRIAFSVHPTGITLDQSFESCAGASCETRSDVVAEGGTLEWRRLVVALETFETTVPPYGRIEVTVDGGDLIVLPLTVTPFEGPAEIHAGITVADDAPAAARIDDVLFFTR